MSQFSEKWFTRQQGTIKGPFTIALLRSNLQRGRLAESDEVSQDQQHWLTLADVLAATDKRQQKPPSPADTIKHPVDERDGFDRRTGLPQQSSAIERAQRKKTRREKEKANIVRRRQLRTRRMSLLLTRKENWFWPLFSLSAVITALFLIAFFYPTLLPLPDTACDEPAQAHVNWENCIKLRVDLTDATLRHANLRNMQLMGAQLMGADLHAANLSYANLQETNLSYADLSDSNLMGSHLQHADLSNSLLAGADLSFADLTGANIGGSELAGARLHNAIWIDGSTCLPASIGTCLQATP